MERVYLYDTTLRDGAQQVGVSLSLEDKLRILERLDRFGVDYVEGGWPGSNPKDLEFFRRTSRMRLRHTRLTAFGSTRRPGVAAAEDANLQSLVASGAPVCTVFGKSWLLHVREALGTTPDENLAMIGDTVRYLKAAGREVIYDAEHFFDGYRDDPGYALATLAAAADAGADWLVLCDTNGGSLPAFIAAAVGRVVGVITRPVGIHTHDDGGLAVANSLAAVEAGARQVQGTVNGYGERCGNANLCTVAANLVLKCGFACAVRLEELTAVSRFVSELVNLPPVPGAAYVGPNAFAHKGGVHVSAILRNPACYEHVPPERVGNRRHVVVSELSGGSNLTYKATELGLEGLLPHERRLLLERVKQLEFEGYEFEAADASLALLARKVLRPYPPFFRLEGFHVSVQRRGDGPAYAEATVKVRVGDQSFHTAADGDGPVNALDRALRKALEGPFPEVRQMELVDYKVRVIPGTSGTSAADEAGEPDDAAGAAPSAGRGTAARVRVLIETAAPWGTWTTVGVSENIIAASYQALTESIEYGLLAWREGTSAAGLSAAEASG